MNIVSIAVGAMLCAQLPASPPAAGGRALQVPSMPAASLPGTVSSASPVPAPTFAPQPVGTPISVEDVQDPAALAPNFAPPPAGYVVPPAGFNDAARGLFESDHAFDGFTHAAEQSRPVQGPALPHPGPFPLHGQLVAAEHARDRRRRASRSTPCSCGSPSPSGSSSSPTRTAWSWSRRRGPGPSSAWRTCGRCEVRFDPRRGGPVPVLRRAPVRGPDRLLHHLRRPRQRTPGASTASSARSSATTGTSPARSARTSR